MRKGIATIKAAFYIFSVVNICNISRVLQLRLFKMLAFQIIIIIQKQKEIMKAQIVFQCEGADLLHEIY
jgi:hypothetical protein